LKLHVFITCILFAFTLSAQELSKSYFEINDLIIVDSKKAKETIDSLEFSFLKNSDERKLAELKLNAIEYYRSIGDFSHMKHILYDELQKVDESTPLRIKLGLDFFLAANSGFEQKDKQFLKINSRVLAAAKLHHFPFLESQSLILFGNYFVRDGHYEKGQWYYAQGLKLLKKLNLPYCSEVAEMKRGIGYFYEGKTQDAFRFFHKGLQYSKQKNLNKSYCQYLTYIAEAHLFNDDLDSAYYYYNEFLQWKDKADIRDVYGTYTGLEYYFSRIGNIDSAYHYSKLVIAVDDSIELTMDKELGDEFEFMYNEARNKELIKAKDKEVADQKEKNKNQWIVFSIVGSVLLTFLGMLVFSNRQKNKLNIQLSEQKEAIAQKNSIIDSALKEKEVLLKEIHHRVKNNLQVISSLLNLQSKGITDEHARQVLEDGKERIQAIALIHHRLYQNEVLSYITMQDYLPDLINQLKRTYVSADKQIQTKIETNGVRISMDTAVPLGLIVCEMITNAYKHAFQGRDTGEIKVELKPSSNTSYFELTIEDNGIGIKDGINFPQEGSLGAEIITALSEQLNGELFMTSSEEGTKFKLIFQDAHEVV
jgi:two-component sensor histidine kinase